MSVTYYKLASYLLNTANLSVNENSLTGIYLNFQCLITFFSSIPILFATKKIAEQPALLDYIRKPHHKQTPF